jgi:hypothetical protein
MLFCRERDQRSTVVADIPRRDEGNAEHLRMSGCRARRDVASVTVAGEHDTSWIHALCLRVHRVLKQREERLGVVDAAAQRERPPASPKIANELHLNAWMN